MLHQQLQQLHSSNKLNNECGHNGINNFKFSSKKSPSITIFVKSVRIKTCFTLFYN